MSKEWQNKNNTVSAFAGIGNMDTGSDSGLEADWDDVESFPIQDLKLTSGTTVALKKIFNTVIRVVEGEIHQEKVDVIVNSTSKNLDLSKGAASRALLNASREDLQKECREKYPKGIEIGNLAVTSGGNLNAKKIYHGALKKWQSTDSTKELKTFVQKCFQQCDRDQFSSIAFPALCTGFLSYPKHEAVKVCLETLLQYKQDNLLSKICDVRFVIYQEDRDTLKIFGDAVKNIHKLYIQNIVTETLNVFQAKNTKVEILIGDILNCKSDAIVNSVNTCLNLGKGCLSKTISEAGGPMIQKQCNTDYSKGIDEGNVAITGPGDLDCKHVFHACLAKYDKDDRDFSRQHLVDIVKSCLGEADKLNLKSISFPALGTKHKKYPMRCCAQALLIAVQQYLTETSTELKLIKIVVFHADKNTIGKAFSLECAEKGITETKRNTKEYCEIKYKETIRVPNSWTHFSSNLSLKELKTETPLDESCKTVLVPSTSNTFKEITEMVLQTWKEKYVGHGKDAAGLRELKYNNVKVIEIRRFENIDLFESYSNARSKIFFKASKRGICTKAENAENSSGPLLTMKHIGNTMKNTLHHEINEVYLFHGTKNKNLEAIVNQGLDCRLGEAKGMFGRGVYMCESSTKADQYSDPIDERDKKDKKMILARVCLGNLFVQKVPRDFDRPPCMDKQCNGLCKHSETEHYDSILGDGKWNFREIVLYERCNCYPEYEITYQRI